VNESADINNVVVNPAATKQTPLASTQANTSATNKPPMKKKKKTACNACKRTDHQRRSSKLCPTHPKYVERAVVDGSGGGKDDEVVEGGMVIITPAANDDYDDSGKSIFALRLCI
jgi:hypothetical protein